MPETPEQRLLLVHAHPDDETINQGATMARYVAEGRGVTLVTCTAGEMGEVLVPDLEHLAAHREDALGEHRRGELAEAMAVLGVTDHRFLGGFGTYRDSGMKWHEDGHAIPADEVHANAFWHADLTEAADHLVADHPRGAPAGAGHLRPVRRLRPPRPHPGPPGRHVRHAPGRDLVLPSRPRRAVGGQQGLLGRDVGDPDAREPRARSAPPATPRPSPAWSPTATCRRSSPPTHLITARVDGSAHVEQKMHALKQHRTQVEVDGPFFSGAESGHAFWAEESFRIVRGDAGPGPEGWETDLFAGL